MPIIPNGIIIACHISRPLGAASQGRKKKERLCPGTMVGGGQSRSFLWEGNRLLGQIDRDGQFVELGLLDDAGSIQQSGSRTPSV